MAIGYTFVGTGLVMIITGWSKVYFSSNQLLTDGIYGVLRHPQYTGIFLAIFGQLVHWPTIPTLAPGTVIVLAYVPLSGRAEAQLHLDRTTVVQGRRVSARVVPG